MTTSVESLSLLKVREQLLPWLTPAESLRAPEGVSTGLNSLDEFLLWKGLPQNELSIFINQMGQGGTSLWLRAAEQLTQKNKKVAWVSLDSWLMPDHLKRRNIDLQKLFLVRYQNSESKLFWILQELITSTLFEMVGCQLPEKNFALKPSELQKLKQLAKAYKVALVFLAEKLPQNLSHHFSLIIDFHQGNLHVRRALHRPTPFIIQTQEALLANPMLELSSAVGRLVG